MKAFDFSTLLASAAGVRDAAIEGPALPTVHRCTGRIGCVVVVSRRGARCSACDAALPRELHGQHLRAARASLDGARWCVPSNPAYATATRKIRALCAALLDTVERDLCAQLIGGAWHRDFNGVLLLGPTGIGKSRVLGAIGTRILDAAEAGKLDHDPAAFKFAAGIRYTSGAELAHAREEHRLGGGEPPILAEARGASLLLLDEVGFEDQGRDPGMIRELLRYRYEHKLIYRPTILASGSTLAELHRDYGEAAIRLVHERGRLIDLHPRTPARPKGGPR